MKTIFDKTTRDGIITRINYLEEINEAQWGKMNINTLISEIAEVAFLQNLIQ